MERFTDLGTVTVKHISGMAETDKGHRFPGGNSVSKGDQLVEINGKKSFMTKEDWAEISAVDGKKKSSKKSTEKNVSSNEPATGMNTDTEPNAQTATNGGAE